MPSYKCWRMTLDNNGETIQPRYFEMDTYFGGRASKKPNVDTQEAFVRQINAQLQAENNW
jgi:hypothetical protein